MPNRGVYSDLSRYAYLSEMHARLIEHAIEDPNLSRREHLDRSGMPLFAKTYEYPLQPWPLLIDSSTHAELGRAAVELVRIVKDIPNWEFHGSIGRTLNYFHASENRLAYRAWKVPGSLSNCIARCDFVMTSDGPKLVEINLGPSIGGWQIYLFDNAYRHVPEIKSFLRNSDTIIRTRNPLAEMIRYAISCSLDFARKNSCTPGVGIAVTDEMLPLADELIQEGLGGIDPNLSNALDLYCFSNASEVASDGRGITIDGKPVTAALIYVAEAQLQQALFRHFEAGRICLLNSPLASVLSNKRSMVLMSERLFGRYSERASSVARKCIPWTRLLSGSSIDFRGARGPLRDVLSAYQDHLVIKPADGYQGDGVVIGCKMRKVNWEHRVNQAIKDGGFLVQQYCEPVPYPGFGSKGVEAHDLALGVFVYGSTFAGSWGRLLPKSDEAGIINSHRGASEAIVFEY